MRKSISIVFLLSVIFISLGLGCYMRSNNGRLLESMYEGIKPKMETGAETDMETGAETDMEIDMETGAETDMETDEDVPLNNDDKSINEETLARKVPDSLLNADESNADTDAVEPFGMIDNSNYATY